MLNNSQFSELYNNCQKFHTKNFSIKFCYSTNFQFGIVVSNNVGNSVVRHKIKRRIKAIIQNNNTKELICAKVAIIAKKSIVNTEFSQLKFDINQALYKVADLVYDNVN